MSRLIRLDLTTEERSALEKGFKYGKSHGFRQRCKMILLKSQSKPSREIAQEMGCCMMAVNGWVKRYQESGIEGLQIKKGRGRKAILDAQQDLLAVRRAVQVNRQRLSLAQQTLQNELGKEFSTLTLKRFLKNIIADTNAFEGE